MRVLREGAAGTAGLLAPGRVDAPERPVASEAPRTWWRERAPGAIFAALLVLGVLPIWLVAHLPTQDGGNHVESVLGLLRLPGSELLRHYYLPNFGLQPNWLTQLMLAALVQVVSPRTGERLILTGYLVLLPLAFRHALPRTERARWVALAIFPFVHSYPFHMGFWNFSYSLVLFFAVVGAWYRSRGRLSGRAGLGFGALMLLAFVAHSVSTASALAAIAALLAWRAGLGWYRSRARPARARRLLRGYVRRALATGLYALPTVALLGAFLLRQPKPLAYRPSLFDYVKHFASLYALVSFDRAELVLCGAVALLLAWAVVGALRERTTRRLRATDGWLAAAVLATALYFAMPDSAADGAQLNDRLALYPWFAGLLWLGWSSVRVPRVRAVALGLVVLFLAGSALRLVKYRQIDAYMEDYLSVASHVPEGSTLLPLTFAPFGPREGGRLDGKKLISYRVQPFTHVAGYLVTDRHAIDLDNSQANTQHTPLRWRPELNPFMLMSTRAFGMEAEPPCVELWTFTALGGRIDRVLVWGATPAASIDTCGAAVLRELAEGWQRVYVSPRGMVQLFEPAVAARR